MLQVARLEPGRVPGRVSPVSGAPELAPALGHLLPGPHATLHLDGVGAPGAATGGALAHAQETHLHVGAAYALARRPIGRAESGQVAPDGPVGGLLCRPELRQPHVQRLAVGPGLIEGSEAEVLHVAKAVASLHRGGARGGIPTRASTT